MPFAAIVALGVVVRTAFLGDPQLVRDEAASWYLASQPLGGLLGQSSHETFPPLYVLLLKGWMTLLGDSEAALRSLSVVVGIGTVVVTWRWARDAVGSTSALIAAALVALSPALVISSRDTRMYSLETFFATTGWWLLWLLVARGRGWLPWRRRAVAVGLFLLVAGEVWTLSLGIPTAGLQLAFALIALLWLRIRVAATATVCVLIGALSLTPWLPNLLSVAANGQAFWTPRPDIGSLAATLGAWFLGDQGGVWALAVVVAGACALLGLGALWRDRRPASTATGDADLQPDRDPQNSRLLSLAVVFGASLVPAVWAYSQFNSIYDPRYFGSALPPLAVAIGVGVVVIARHTKPRLVVTRLPGGLLAALLALLVVGAMAIGTAQVVATSRAKSVEPGRQVVQELADRVRPGDVVITLNAQTFFPLEYYLVASGEAQRLGVELYDWHRPTAAFFTGWQDIDASSIVDAGKVASLGWEGAVHLAPGRSLWLVTLVDPGYEFPLFSPLQSGDLREILRVDVRVGGLTAEIREAVPVGAQPAAAMWRFM
jgi:4-amino-4-deoxy-L-arabinose transferase-like glycosyltransferase